MWTFPVPIPSRIPSTPWKTDTRTAGSGLPSSFSFMSTQRRPHNSGAVRHLQQEHPRRMLLFFVRLSTPARTEKEAQTGQARQKRKTRTRSVNAPLSCPCLSHRAGPSPAVAPYFSENAPAGPSLSGFWQPVPRPLRPRPSGLRPLSPRAKISFCPCPAAGTGAPARPRASASTVPAGDAVQTLPRIIP